MTDRAAPAKPARRSLSPVAVDVFMAFGGLTLTALGAALIYAPAGLIVAGVGLLYLGLWHR